MVYLKEAGIIIHLLKTKTEDVLNIDAIYVSHLHSDHFDIRTFKKFKKSTPIIILDREPNFLLEF